jgi:hypothetical protein
MSGETRQVERSREDGVHSKGTSLDEKVLIRGVYESPVNLP